MEGFFGAGLQVVAIVVVVFRSRLHAENRLD
jgi:hypothetical protein